MIARHVHWGILAFGIVVMISLFFQEPVAAVTRATRKSYEPSAALVSQTFEGVILSIEKGNPKRGIRAKITAVDASGKKMNFVITNQTKVYDKNQTDPFIAQVHKNDHIIIKFKTAANGLQEAVVVNFAE